MKILKHIHLFYSEGRSDKEYHAELVAVSGGHVVNFRYGRRGAALTSGTKTPVPFELAQAEAIYEKLVKEKIAKGYTPEVSGSAYQGTEHAGQLTGFMPQLLNPITEQEAMAALADNRWAAQEKMDGERRAVLADEIQVIGANRKGFSVPLPQSMVDELHALVLQRGAFQVDGELIGECLYVFDLLAYQGQCLDAMPWIKRMQLAEKILAGCIHLKTVPVAVSTEDKFALWEKVRAEDGEGVVFKRLNALITAGRPNSGGDWLKFKFTESASCCVIDINAGKRSVQIGLLESKNRPEEITDQKLIPVGNVTIPAYQSIPAAGTLIEVNYLYAYPGGSLYQPVYRGKRTDLDLSACHLQQLKYKPVGRYDDAA